MIVHTTQYGRPAALLLRERISALKGDDPLCPVTVVLPTNYVGVSTRRLLASGGLGAISARGNGIAGLTLLTVYRLAELLGAPRLAAAGRRPVSTPVVGAAVRQVLRDAPGVFAPVRDHPSTEEALVRAHRELSEVQARTLDALAATGTRAAEVVRVHRTVRQRLAARWFDEADLMRAGEEAVRAGASVLGDIGTVLVYLPQDLSLPQAALLRAVADVAAVEVIAAMTGAADADADVERTLHRLGAHMPPAPRSSSPVITAPAVTTVVSVSDAEEEVRSALARVVDAARDGVALERMAIVYPAAEPYARIVNDQLLAAEVPFNGRAVRPLTDRLLGRWLLDLLALPDARFARPAVLGLLCAAPVRDDSGRRVAAGSWERISREAGIVHGVGEWRVKLTRFAHDARARADEEESRDEPREWLVHRLRRSADQADALRRFVSALCGELERAERVRRWRDLADWCHTMIGRFLGDERRREHWPQAERAAAERVEEALDRLAALDEVEDATDLRVFRRALQLELDDDLGRVGEFGEGVLVGTLSAALGVDLDLVVVLGLAEGVLPTRPREDSLLPDADRAVVADELRPRGELSGVEHRHLLAALAASQGQRVVTFPRGDLRRSMERAPSRWLLDAVQTLRDDDERRLPEAAPWLQVVPSFAHRARTAPFPDTRQLYGLRALAGRDAPAGLSAHPLVRADDALRLGVELVAGRRDDAFTRFDGNLAHLAPQIPSPAAPGHASSASRLEAWLACPHGYFAQYLLRVEPVENPEELLEIGALEKGSLVHDVLERWLLEQLDGALPDPSQPWPDKARRRMRELAEEACGDAEERGLTGHPLLWARDRHRILVDLERFVDHDDVRRRELGLTPLAAERPFGIPGTGTEPLAVDLGDGRSVRVHGRIDRVDRARDGTLVVADYKTGGAYGYRDLATDQPLGDGTKLQLALYGLAVGADRAPVRAEYWFVSTKAEFKRVGYVVDDPVVEQLRRALRVAVDGIEHGRFPMRPPAPRWSMFTECRYCDPDELGTSDRYRDWERIRHAPQLREYVTFMEPGTDETEEPR